MSEKVAKAAKALRVYLAVFGFKLKVGKFVREGGEGIEGGFL